MDIVEKLREEERLKKKFKSKKIKEVIVIKDEESSIEIPMKSGEIIVRQGRFLVRFD